MAFNPGFNIKYDLNTKDFIYGSDVFGPDVEKRKLDDIRKTLMDPMCEGPDVVYTIAMDVGNNEDKEDLIQRQLLFGACIYSDGKLGNEPVRSQGHVHAISPSCMSSTAELYEIWEGEAIIFMQSSTSDDPGRLFAIKAKEGDKVIVPPGWAHYTVNANPDKQMVFGAWCIRDYGFDYKEVREHGGLAYFPVFNEETIHFIVNPLYETKELIIKEPRIYDEFNVDAQMPLYTQYLEDKNRFDFVTNPNAYQSIWEHFIP